MAPSSSRRRTTSTNATRKTTITVRPPPTMSVTATASVLTSSTSTIAPAPATAHVLFNDNVKMGGNGRVRRRSHYRRPSSVVVVENTTYGVHQHPERRVRWNGHHVVGIVGHD